VSQQSDQSGVAYRVEAKDANGVTYSQGGLSQRDANALADDLRAAKIGSLPRWTVYVEAEDR
jgi:hypothetical protein